jgi:hypothetical protein
MVSMKSLKTYRNKGVLLMVIPPELPPFAGKKHLFTLIYYSKQLSKNIFTPSKKLKK